MLPFAGSGLCRVSREPEAVTICCSFVPANCPRMACVTADAGCSVREYMNIEDVVAMSEVLRPGGLNVDKEDTMRVFFTVLYCFAPAQAHDLDSRVARCKEILPEHCVAKDKAVRRVSEVNPPRLTPRVPRSLSTAVPWDP